MSGTVQPADVYEKVETVYAAVMWLARLTGILCVIVLLQIAAKSIIFFRIVRLLDRVERLLALAERHGALTDDKAVEFKRAVQQEAENLKAELPPKVAEAVTQAANTAASNSGTNLPTVVFPPQPGL